MLVTITIRKEVRPWGPKNLRIWLISEEIAQERAPAPPDSTLVVS